MGFGITSLKKKSVKENIQTKILTPHLLVGDDFATCIKFCQLVKDHGADNIIWLKNHLETTEQIENKWNHFSFLSVRKSEFDQAESCSFYKDQQFKNFGGRSQPQEMSDIEIQLVGHTESKTWNELLEEFQIQEQWSEFDNHTQKCVKEVVIANFASGDVDDLVEANYWGVMTTKNEFFLSENCYWGASARKLRSIMDRSSLNSETTDSIEFQAANQVEVPAFVVHFEFDKEIKLDAPTSRVFIPVSQSQEQGHFVGLIKETSVSFFHHFQDELEVNKEEVAKRLKKLKRNLERIFKTEIFNNTNEMIYFSSSLFCLPLESFEENDENTPKNLHFLSNQSSRKNVLLDKINLLK